MKRIILSALCVTSLMHIQTVYTMGDATKVTRSGLTEKQRVLLEGLANDEAAFNTAAARKFSFTLADFRAWKSGASAPKPQTGGQQTGGQQAGGQQGLAQQTGSQPVAGLDAQTEAALVQAEQAMAAVKEAAPANVKALVMGRLQRAAA